MLNFLKKLKRSASKPQTSEERAAQRLSKSLDRNIEMMRSLFSKDSDFFVRSFTIPVSGGIRAALCFIDGMASADLITSSVLTPLMLEARRLAERENIRLGSIEELYSSFIPSGEAKTAQTFEDAAGACLIGDAALFVDGYDELVCVSTKGYDKRGVTEPQTETVVRGPREGFTEVLKVNTSLLRRKLKTSHLRMETMTIGRRTSTLVCLSYLDNIADPALIDDVRRRLRRIDTDAILSSGYIEEFIEDSPLSMFPTTYYTEKPDVVAAMLLEGRCALIIDGTPFVLTMPMLFLECFQSPEDYAVRAPYTTFLRIMRLLSFFLSLTAPAIYVALTSFHQELLPTDLLFTIASSSEALPFPSAVETTIMLITFEILKEAGVRLPRPVGQTVSIVGALVMGQAAIQAGIVGAPVVIIIAFTAVASFVAPSISDATSILRWYLLVLASCMGGFGIAIGMITILFHLSSLKSFGTPYLYPFAPFVTQGLKDAVVRSPVWKMRTRPSALRPQDSVRQQDNIGAHERSGETTPDGDSPAQGGRI